MAGMKSLYPGQIWSAVALTSNTSAQCGASIQITASVAGTVTLTLWSGVTIIVTVGVGDSIYPYQCTKFVAGTATVTSAYNLFQ